MNEYVYIDFEFNGTTEPKLKLICASLQVGNYEPEEFWLWENQASQDDLKKYILQLASSGVIFVCYASVEPQAFLALGIDRNTVLNMQWVDLLQEWKQLQNRNNDRQYGPYIKADGSTGRSKPPKLHASANLFADNMKVGKSMAQACYNMLDILIDTPHKNEMRQLCIHNTSFTLEERNNIQDYCTSDIKHLPALLTMMGGEIFDIYAGDVTREQIQQDQLIRGRTSACTGIMTTLGQPVDAISVENLRINSADVKKATIEGFNTNVFPIWQKRRINLRTTKTTMVKSAQHFAKFVHQLGLSEMWPLTESGYYSQKEDDLKKFKDIPDIKKFSKVVNRLKQLGYVDGTGKTGCIQDYIGSDNRIRSYLNPYGGQTGRWQPKATSYVFLMAAVFRCLLRAPEGYNYIGLDWAGQEFAIAGVLSGDENMMAAYESGDQYLYLAKKIDAVPADATKQSHPDMREAFKVVTLGKQFGMGIGLLTDKVTWAVCDGDYTKGKELANVANKAHMVEFAQYWAWYKEGIRHYHDKVRGGYFRLNDGWTMWGDNDKDPSVGNFRIQGAGGSMLREGIYRSLNCGLDVVAPLHDAIYFLQDETKPEQIECGITAMDEAVEHTLGAGVKIRVDVDTHPWSEPWIDGRAATDYEFLAQYMKSSVSKKEQELYDFCKAFNLIEK